MHIFRLLDAGFDVAGNNGIVVLGLANVLKQTAVTYLAGCGVDTPEIEHDFAKQLLLDDGEDVRVGRSVDDYLLQQVEGQRGDVFLG